MQSATANIEAKARRAVMKLSDLGQEERNALAALESRIVRIHLRQRLGLQGEHEARVFRKGTHFFHIENWYSLHGLIRGALTLAGLHGRGRRNPLRLQLRRNDVVLPSLPAAFDGYTLLQLSDLHLDIGEAPVLHPERPRPAPARPRHTSPC